MMLFISCAKTMATGTKLKVPVTTIPQFQAEALQNALEMMHYSVDELSDLLHINAKLAAQNVLRYHDFASEDGKRLPAILAYTGIVFKRLSPTDFTADDFLYAQDHLRISSFLYGLLRPLDLVKNYRLEGNVRLPLHGDRTLFDYWKPLLTEVFIEQIRAQGGVLINLASSEMKDLFDWSRVEAAVRVITPDFQVIKGGVPKTVVIYAKMCRGEMTRYILKNRLEDPEALKQFHWEGFSFQPVGSSDNRYLFTLDSE